MVTYRDESAFPATDYCDERPVGCSEGLNKREYFAAVALQGLLGAATPLALTHNERVVAAVAIADLLIEELNNDT